MTLTGRLSIVLAVLLLASCSSPTAPTTPKTPEPPSPPTPALTIACPQGVTATTPEGVPVAVNFPAATASGGVAPVEVSCTRQPGSLFTAGVTEVQCTATDAANQSAACVFAVSVTALAPQLTRTKFLAFGDSLTMGEVTVPTARGYKLSVMPAASYPTRLDELLKSRYRTQVSSIEVVNAGWSGEWAQDGAKRLVQVLNSTRVEVLLILEGANDIATLLSGGIPLAGTAVGTMIREGKSRGAEVLVGTLPPGRTGDHQIDPGLVTRYNDRLRQVAAIEGATLVDLYSGMLANVDAYIGADGLHPTPEGYARMAELFAATIRAQFEVK